MSDDNIKYSKHPDTVITPKIKEDAIKTKSYFIYPSEYFVNVVATATAIKNINMEMKIEF